MTSSKKRKPEKSVLPKIDKLIIALKIVGWRFYLAKVLAYFFWRIVVRPFLREVRARKSYKERRKKLEKFYEIRKVINKEEFIKEVTRIYEDKKTLNP